MSSRFSIAHELNRVDQELNRVRNDWGTQVLWYRRHEESPTHDVYDYGDPRQWHDPVIVPVLWALKTEGLESFGSEGRRSFDGLQFAVAKNIIRDQLGWEGLLTREGQEAFLNDRIEYEERVFRVIRMEVAGQLHDRDVVVGVTGREVSRHDQWLDEPPVPEDPVYD